MENSKWSTSRQLTIFQTYLQRHCLNQSLNIFLKFWDWERYKGNVRLSTIESQHSRGRVKDIWLLQYGSCWRKYLISILSRCASQLLLEAEMWARFFSCFFSLLYWYENSLIYQVVTIIVIYNFFWKLRLSSISSDCKNIPSTMHQHYPAPCHRQENMFTHWPRIQYGGHF